jgi:predicted phosphodiesterase
MSEIRGLFLSDLHYPDNISVLPIYSYAKDLKPTHIILGGDIIDAKGMFGVDSMAAASFDNDWYKRDLEALKDIIGHLPKCQFVMLEGNHEHRYTKLMNKFPKVFKGAFEFKSALPKGSKWISYGTYDSIYRLADTIFVHGDAYPDSHAKYYANAYPGYKVVYGHLHHYQAYSNRRALIHEKLNYAVTAGCLCGMDPDWKQGKAHQWQNGFISFVGDEKTLHLSAHTIEKGEFYVGSKCYK